MSEKLSIVREGDLRRLLGATKRVERANLRPDLTTARPEEIPLEDKTIAFKNISGSDIPEGGCVRLNTAGADGILIGRQPDVIGRSDIVIATSLVPNGSYGRGYSVGAECKVTMVSTVGVTAGERVGVTPSAWTAQADDLGPIEVLAVLDATTIRGRVTGKRGDYAPMTDSTVANTELAQVVLLDADYWTLTEESPGVVIATYTP